MRGLYIGRFQPFHLGHLEAIKYCLSSVDELIIGIGSSQESYTARNPFTLTERVKMVVLSLIDANIDFQRIFLVAIPDSREGERWCDIVLDRCPRFDLAFSNDPWTISELNEAGIEVHPIPFYKRDLYIATKIRDAILSGENWEQLVPNPTKEVLTSINARKRLQRIYNLL